MSLRPETKFEDDTPPAAATTQTEATASAPAAAPAEQPSAATAVATKAPSAVAALKGGLKNPFTEMKNALRVDFNTLAQIQANQGQFRDREGGKASLGDTIALQILSYQDAFVVTPNDNDADKEMVRYSDDGVMCTDGVTTCADHLKFLNTQGYEKAKIQPRVVLVGALLEASKPTKLLNELVQISLSPSSKAKFERYQANAAWKTTMGGLTAEQAVRVRLVASVETSNGNDYTVVNFETMPTA